MIIVTGATGALNGGTVDALLETLDPSEIVVVARDLDKARRFTDLGVQVRQGGYGDPDSLPDAFAGADQLLLVSSNDPGADAVSLHRVAIKAAVRAGVGRILYTSHQGAAPTSPFNPARVHYQTEQLLADSGVAWTSLRNGFYAHSLAWLMGPWRETGSVVVPADGPVSWTWREDEAAAAAAVLLSDGAYEGPVTLTASEALTFAEVAAIASELTGRPITSGIVDPERWVANQIASGQPEFVARFTLGMYQAAAQGFFAGTADTVRTLLGRKPRGVRDFLELQIAEADDPSR